MTLLALAGSFPASTKPPASLPAPKPQTAKPLGFTFDPGMDISNRFITPNGDLRNDNVVFTFGNPRDSAINGRIFDLKGAFVADMVPGPKPDALTDSLKWDGKADGKPAKGGVYIYVIWSEDKVHCGTVVVVL